MITIAIQNGEKADEKEKSDNEKNGKSIPCSDLNSIHQNHLFRFDDKRPVGFTIRNINKTKRAMASR